MAIDKNVHALKLAAEAFARRNMTTGLNAWDAVAMQACKEAIHAETGEVLISQNWAWKFVPDSPAFKPFKGKAPSLA